jgi:hypothetical protein
VHPILSCSSTGKVVPIPPVDMLFTCIICTEQSPEHGAGSSIYANVVAAADETSQTGMSAMAIVRYVDKHRPKVSYKSKHGMRALHGPTWLIRPSRRPDR